MFETRWKLFKLYGFEVSLDPSWIVIAVLVTWSLAEGYFPRAYPNAGAFAYWLMGAAGALGLFASIVFHEFWHSFVAQKYGLPMKGITLFLFGGMAQMEEEPKNAKTELLMAAAGPLANIVLGFVFYGLSELMAPDLTLQTLDQGSQIAKGAADAIPEILLYLAVINWILAAFNLLPAFPMDGGRILRSTLWMLKKDQHWATRIATSIGVGFGWGLIALGLLNIFGGNVLGGVWYTLIGVFLSGAARAQSRKQESQYTFQQRKVGDLMSSDPVSLDATTTVSHALDNELKEHDYKFYPVLKDGALAGCIATRRIRQIPPEERDTTLVGDMISACSRNNAVAPGASAADALQIMQTNGLQRLLVVENNDLVGVVTLRDLIGERDWLERLG